MIRNLKDLPVELRRNIRGGKGEAAQQEYLAAGEMGGILGASRITLQPGASIGQHLHPDTEEFYLVLQGRGTGYLDGDPFPVGPGDGFLLKAGHSHGLVNDSPEKLVFFAFLTGSSAP